MPELPEVETERGRLAARIEGRRIVEARIDDPRLTRPEDPALIAARLTGERVEAVERRGKYIVVRLDRRRGAARPPAHDRRLPLRAGEPRAGRARARRRDADRLPRPAPLRDVAAARAERGRGAPGVAARPRAARPRLHGRLPRRRLAGRKAPVKAAILDQRTVAGLGNIYADEALWHARIHPLRPAGALGVERGRAAAGRRSARRSGSASAARARTWATAPTPAGGCSDEFKAYGRAGEPCDRCGTPIEKTRAGGRGHLVLPRLPGVTATNPWNGGCPTPDVSRQVPRSRERFARVESLERGGRSRTRLRSSSTRPGPVAASPETRLVPMGRTYKTEAVVLRSIRYAEADRILHLYTADRGRVGAIAKGIRKTTSRVGGRLEPLGHVELMLHQGGGELHTVTGVELIRPHSATRDDPYRLAVGLIGAEAMLRLFTEQEANERAFAALTRFLDLLDETPRRSAAGARPARAVVPAQAALAVRLPAAPRELRRVRLRRAARRLLRAGRRDGVRGLQRGCAGALGRRARRDGRRSCAARSPTRRPAGLTERGARDVLAVITVLVRGARRLPAADAAAPDDPEARRRLRARRRPRAGRRRRRPRVPDASRTGRRAGRARRWSGSCARRAAGRRPVPRRATRSGFCRAVSDDASVTYLADVYVLPEHRGRGLGEELVREMVDNGPYAAAPLAPAHARRARALPAVRLRRRRASALMERPPA